MSTLKACLQTAKNNGTAIGHFNVSDMLILKAVFESARAVDVPVIVGASEGERSYFGVAQLAAMVRILREQHGSPLFLNADHTHSLASAIEAAKAGFDSIVYDLSALPFETNIKRTREAVEILKSVNPDIVIEGEIGDIGIGSEIHATQTRVGPLTTPQEAAQYVDATKVDVLAPAVGNMHGMVKAMVEGNLRKHLDVARIREIKNATSSFLTLHGGSGTDDGDLQEAIAAGINIVHINTEVRVAWRRGLEGALAKDANEIVPYKLLPAVEEAIREVVTQRLRSFSERPAR